MSYTGIVNYDLLTLIQILAWGEEPAGVEFFDERGIFTGKIYIEHGCLKGAVYKDLKGVEAFIRLVAELNNTGGAFHKIPYIKCPPGIAAPESTRIDSLLLSAIADKETKEGQAYLEAEERPSPPAKETTTSYYKLASTRVAQVTHSPVNTQIREHFNRYIIPSDLFPRDIREIVDVYTLFNLESLMLHQGISGHLILFTQKFWQSLFPHVELSSLDEQGIQAHTCITMANIVKHYLERKCPNFDNTLNSEDLLEMVNNAIGEATQDEHEVKIVPVNPEQIYDEEISMVEGFSDTTLTEPSQRMEEIYRWLEEKLEQESAPLQYFFYPDKHTKFIESKSSEPFRVVVAALHPLCQKICVNLKYYLASGRELILYSIEDLQDFQLVERGDWEDCHLTILEHPFVQKIYHTLSRIPEKMATVIVAEKRDIYRPYLGAPRFRERVQGVYSSDDQDLAHLIIRVWEIVSG